jgi:hypothetical protein
VPGLITAPREAQAEPMQQAGWRSGNYHEPTNEDHMKLLRKAAFDAALIAAEKPLDSASNPAGVWRLDENSP